MNVSVSPVADPAPEREGPGAVGWLLILAGLLLCTAAIVAFVWALYSVGRIGTCASGGPYVSARACPEGTGLKIMLLMGSVFGGLLGIALYAAGWGRAKRAARAGLGLGTLMWSFLFLGSAAAMALAAWGPAADGAPGVSTAAIVLVIVFVPMGIAPLLGLAAFGRRPRAAKAATASAMPPGIPGDPSPARPDSPRPMATPRAAPAPPAPAGDDDPVAQLERLARLRESGALSEAEFERLKAQILS